MGLNYEPRSDPLDPDSEPVKAQIVRLTGERTLFVIWNTARPIP